MLGRRSFRPKVFLIWASALTMGLRGAGYLFDFLGNPSDLTASGHVVDSLGDPLPLEYSTADHGKTILLISHTIPHPHPLKQKKKRRNNRIQKYFFNIMLLEHDHMDVAISSPVFPQNYVLRRCNPYL